MFTHPLKRPAAFPAFMAFLLIATSIGLHASTANAASLQKDAVQVTIGSSQVAIGSMIDVPVTLQKPDVGIASYGMQIDFDTASLEVVSITPNYGSTDETKCAESVEGCFQSQFDNKEGWLRAAWVDGSGGESPLTHSLQLYTIRLKPKSSGTLGEKILTVDSSQPDHLAFSDSNAALLPVVLQTGSITVRLAPAESSETPIRVVIDGKEQENSATARTETINNHKVTTVTVDDEKVLKQIAGDNLRTLVIPVSGDSSIVTGELNGMLVKAMEAKAAVLEIRTDRATYTLPADQINIDQVSDTIGKDVALQDIKISVRIAEVEMSEIAEAEKAAQASGINLIGKPVNFEVTATYGDQIVTIDRFNHYINRAIALPDGIDPAKLTTGVVIHEDGTMTHVPTQIIKKDDKYYALINSLTNSTYTVVWHPKAFSDVQNHWSKSDVNDLASRLVLQGVSTDSFAPERSITRAEFTAITMRALGLHKAAKQNTASFKDVSDQSWYSEAVNLAASYGIISGYKDNTFQPNASITRAEAMVILSRTMKYVNLQQVSDQSETAKLLAPFSDSQSVSEWSREAVAAIIKQGIVKGSNGKINAGSAISRAETAAMVRRLLQQASLIN
ncbi:S-layer homology domain-containing protein [Candidatus Pristimantibacillus sp. PTI5]|uniref:S-layer homology domain-containing protein n=1 Tax=Candidatus Pristimantibacillus sp. PTI5 TaxID=3400422 RepID=UPI003B02BB44